MIASFSLFTAFFLVFNAPTTWAQQNNRENQQQNQVAENECFTDTLYTPRHASTDLSSILDFELNLFQKFSSLMKGKNLFFSPFSIWNALAVLYLGSSSRTENQMKFALGLRDKQTTWRLLRELQLLYKLRNLKEKGSNVLEFVNRVYFDDSIPVRACMEGVLHSEMFTINFNKPKQAADTINKFVSKTTRGKINEIVQPRAVQGALMAVVNAGYFKGAWLSPFDPKDTKVQDFTNVNGKKIPVDMMSRFGEFYGVSDKELQADILELPYYGGSIAMYMFKPYMEGQIHIDNLINAINKDSLVRVMNFLNTTATSTTQLSLPRFKIDTTIQEEMLPVLDSIGITDIFDPNHADFSDFSKTNLFVKGAVHQAVVEVTEEGTEAASATVFISTKIGGINFFTLDRPFVFAIVDKETSNIYFMGSLLSPEPSLNKGKDLLQGVQSSNVPVQTQFEPQQQQQEQQDLHTSQFHVQQNTQEQQQHQNIKQQQT